MLGIRKWIILFLYYFGHTIQIIGCFCCRRRSVEWCRKCQKERKRQSEEMERRGWNISEYIFDVCNKYYISDFSSLRTFLFVTPREQGTCHHLGSRKVSLYSRMPARSHNFSFIPQHYSLYLPPSQVTVSANRTLQRVNKFVITITSIRLAADVFLLDIAAVLSPVKSESQRIKLRIRTGLPLRCRYL